MPRHEDHALRPLLAILDEDARFAHWLRATLEAAGYRSLWRVSYVEAESMEALGVDAVVLDLAGDELDRLGTIRAIRVRSEIPILVATACADERAKIDAFDAGADDYLIKPFLPGEFLARTRVALRHKRAQRGPRGGRVQLGELDIDLLTREAKLRGTRLALTPTDYKLLALLARNQGRVVLHEQLLHEAWGPNAKDPHYLRVYMARLRSKLDPERAGLRYIVTEPGVGYRLLSALKPEKSPQI